MKNKGFTLIELLVVVLIIGILAAIAVPQYQKAVEKSRAMQALTILRSYVDAQEAYYLAHGEYATSTSNLDITLPKLEKWKFIASFNREDPQIAIGAKDNSLWFAYYTHIKKMFCATKTKHEICESFPVIKEDCYGNDLAAGWSCYYFK